MDDFNLRNGELYAEDVPMTRIAAEVGTPVYIYSRRTFERHAHAFRDGLKNVPRVHLAYAIKANPNLAVLRVMANAGYGADVVSGGELERALAAGVPAKDVVFSGVGKTRAELAQGLDRGIGQFNLELEAEGVALSEIAAARGIKAPCVLRVNPDVDAGTHAKISTGKADNKFGVAIADAPAIYNRLSKLPGLNLRGVASHIGSQLLSVAPMERRSRRRVGRRLPRRGQARKPRRLWRDGRARHARLGRRIDVRARPGHRRQRRGAADAGDLGEALAGESLGDRRRGDERPRPARAL